MTQTLLVNRIQRFCLHDGAGLRTTVFLQGCTQHCWWCHNPDTIPAHNDKARTWEIGPLVAWLAHDERFWSRSGGGLTLSGGEPLRQIDAVEDLLRAAGARGWHRCIETAGQVSLAQVQRAAPLIDAWLYDLKAGEAERLRRGSGGDLARILGNLHWLLAQTPAVVCVRIPLINGFNAEPAAWQELAQVLGGLPRPVPVRLLPGHRCGTAPERLEHDPFTPAEVATAASTALRDAGLPVEITW